MTNIEKFNEANIEVWAETKNGKMNKVVVMTNSGNAYLKPFEEEFENAEGDDEMFIVNNESLIPDHAILDVVENDPELLAKKVEGFKVLK